MVGAEEAEVKEEEEVEQVTVEAEEEDRRDISILLSNLHHTRVGQLPHTRVVYQLRAHIRGRTSMDRDTSRILEVGVTNVTGAMVNLTTCMW